MDCDSLATTGTVAPVGPTHLDTCARVGGRRIEIVGLNRSGSGRIECVEVMDRAVAVTDP